MPWVGQQQDHESLEANDSAHGKESSEGIPTWDEPATLTKKGNIRGDDQEDGIEIEGEGETPTSC